MVEFFNQQVSAFANSGKQLEEIDKVINYDPTLFSWDRADKPRLAKGQLYEWNSDAIRTSHYRPFQKQNVYFDRLLNNTIYQLPKIFPTSGMANTGFYYVGMGSVVPFSILMLDSIPDLHVTGAGSGGQFFPRYTYDTRSSAGELDLFDDADPYTRVDNITDEILADYRKLYGRPGEKDDIFYFIYGILHSSGYRTEYAADLKKMLPRIPLLTDAADFWAFAEAGRKLSDLHLGYETLEPFALDEVRPAGASPVVKKMRFGGKAGAWDKTTIRYNDEITLSGIPAVAHKYMLGSRSALEWIIERYQVKTHKDSGIINDPNDWAAEHDDPEYILNLVKRIVTLSVETVAIVDALPSLNIREK